MSYPPHSYGPMRGLLGRWKDKSSQELADYKAALLPFAILGVALHRKPLHRVDDQFYSVHVGTEWEAGIRFSECQHAAKLLRLVL